MYRLCSDTRATWCLSKINDLGFEALKEKLALLLPVVTNVPSNGTRYAKDIAVSAVSNTSSVPNCDAFRHFTYCTCNILYKKSEHGTYSVDELIHRDGKIYWFNPAQRGL